MRWRVVARGVAVSAALALLVGCGGTDSDKTPSAPEEVTIAADGLDLVGTLHRPDVDGPVPGVVIIHGSGPLSRDGTVPGQLGLTFANPVAVYRELAEGLSEQGYAVLTWDKRTCGPFSGCADNDYPAPVDDLTFDDLLADTRAATDLLAGRDDISDVIVIGHSKGGTMAALLAAEREDLAGVVLLASPAPPVQEVLQTQAETFAELVAAAGQSGVTADQAIAGLRELAAEVQDVADGELGGPPIAGASRDFWASSIDASLRAPEQVASADVPVLALGGAVDWNVPPAQVEAWADHLGDQGEVVILPGITHALTRLATGDVAAITPDDVGEQVDASVIETLVTWLDATTGG